MSDTAYKFEQSADSRLEAGAEAIRRQRSVVVYMAERGLKSVVETNGIMSPEEAETSAQILEFRPKTAEADPEHIVDAGTTVRDQAARPVSDDQQQLADDSLALVHKIHDKIEAGDEPAFITGDDAEIIDFPPIRRDTDETSAPTESQAA